MDIGSSIKSGVVYGLLFRFGPYPAPDPFRGISHVAYDADNIGRADFIFDIPADAFLAAVGCLLIGQGLPGGFGEEAVVQINA